MSENKYNSIAELTSTLKDLAQKLESGSLAPEELQKMKGHAQELYERMVILQYKAFTGEEDKTAEVQAEKIEPKEEPVVEQPIVEEKTEPTEEIKEEVKEEVKEPVKEKKPFAFRIGGAPADSVEEPPIVEKFAPRKEEDYISPNQTNLIDAINEQSRSLNEKFEDQKQQSSRAEKLQKSAISDLTQAIAIGQKFLFMNDLFEGENTLYKESIDKLNNFSNILEAEDYIHNNLKEKFDWDMESKSVQDFLELIERRYQ